MPETGFMLVFSACVILSKVLPVDNVSQLEQGQRSQI